MARAKGTGTPAAPAPASGAASGAASALAPALARALVVSRELVTASSALVAAVWAGQSAFRLVRLASQVRARAQALDQELDLVRLAAAPASASASE